MVSGTSGVVQGLRGWFGDLRGGPGVWMGLRGGGRLQIGSCGLRPQPASLEASGQGTSRPVAPGRDGRLRPARDASGGPRPRREAPARARCVRRPQATPGGSRRRATHPAASGHTGRLQAARNTCRGLRPQRETPGGARRVPRPQATMGGSGQHATHPKASGRCLRLRHALRAARSLLLRAARSLPSWPEATARVVRHTGLPGGLRPQQEAPGKALGGARLRNVTGAVYTRAGGVVACAGRCGAVRGGAGV